MPAKTSRAEATAGQVHGGLCRFPDDPFLASIGQSAKRRVANGEPRGFFKGSCRLDAGCDGGKHAVAMARLGASSALGMDIGEPGLPDTVMGHGYYLPAAGK